MHLSRSHCSSDSEGCEFVRDDYTLIATLKGKPARRGHVKDGVFGIGNCFLGLVASCHYVFYLADERRLVLHPGGSFTIGPYPTPEKLEALGSLREPPQTRPRDEGSSCVAAQVGDVLRSCPSLRPGAAEYGALPMEFSPYNLCVIICSHVLDDSRPILLVAHDPDGWNFACGSSDHAGAEDFHPVGVGHLVSRDPSINETAGLPVGFIAERVAKGQPWSLQALQG